MSAIGFSQKSSVWPERWQAVAKITKKVAKSLVTWDWTKNLLYWIILSAGTGSELAFLFASLWVTINASVHGFVLLFLSEQATRHLSELSTVAYVGLPECILALAIVTTLSHLRTWLYKKSDFLPLIWCILYGIPTVIFLVISLITIGNSLLSIDFRLPDWMIVTRGVAGYSYGLIALLYMRLGKPLEADRLKEKDDKLAELCQVKDKEIADLCQAKDKIIAGKDQDIANLRHENAMLKAEKEILITRLDATINEKSALIKAVHKSDDMALEAYSEECQNWLKSDIKTVMADEITRYTGTSKRKIDSLINKGILKPSTRNKDLILMSSVVEWLKNAPAKERNTEPELYVVNHA